MYILGLWDGHDSGAAIIKENKILVAINEERLSRRKLEIRFPEKSISACLDYLNLSHRDISCIAVSTMDFSKTLARVFPSLKEEYYQLRRRKKIPGKFSGLKKLSKYRLTEIGPSALTERISKIIVKSNLRKLGINCDNILFFNHHFCHAVTAAFCSGFDECATVTIDGIGDALSGSIYILKNKHLKLIGSIPGKSSLGIFFEHVTNLMNMRELEDEGKVMALANYAYPIKDTENPLMDFFHIDGVNVKSKYSSLRLYKELKDVLWKYPSEQFAYLAQRVLEVKISELVQNVMRITDQNKVSLSGGVFSNIKVNMCIRKLSCASECFVFPHMGDGGLAVGAALCANYQLNNITEYEFENIFLGLDYQDEDIEKLCEQHNLEYEKKDNIATEAADLIANGEIVFWFQGRMEYGPRALGHRSILALPNSEDIKNQLNLKLKMRVWYQPFCPSVLKEDADTILESYSGNTNPYMTMAYSVKPEWKEKLRGVINIDGTCRPQMVNEGDGVYYLLLKELKKITGIGLVLNTSLNIHGDSLVCSPNDAIETFLKTRNKYMVISNYLIRNHI